MILVRSPLRISLGGGGTDLPSYYSEHEGFLIAASIDKYVYVSALKPFTEKIFLKYSQAEEVSRPEDIVHPIMREIFSLPQFNEKQIEITTLADIPSGTGLGSSGSFTACLIKALYAYKRKTISSEELAKLACKVEIELLKEPIGKQDQYIAAYGGITEFQFQKDGKVNAAPLTLSDEVTMELEDNLLLFFTGFSRSASNILDDQNKKSLSNDNAMIENLHFVKELGLRSKKLLEVGDTYSFGKLLHEHWEHKKSRSKGMSNPKINEWYDLAVNNGAVGGKLVGAGGGGFLMFYAEDKKRLRAAAKDAGLQEIRFKFDFEGTKVVFS